MSTKVVRDLERLQRLVFSVEKEESANELLLPDHNRARRTLFDENDCDEGKLTDSDVVFL